MCDVAGCDEAGIWSGFCREHFWKREVERLEARIAELESENARLREALRTIEREGYECDIVDCSRLATRHEPDGRSICGDHGSKDSEIDYAWHPEDAVNIARMALAAHGKGEE